MRETVLTILKWTGTVLGIIGAILIASHTSFSGWAFILYVVSSSAWTVAALMMKERSLLLQSVVYTGLNIFGVYRWLF